MRSTRPFLMLAAIAAFLLAGACTRQDAEPVVVDEPSPEAIPPGAAQQPLTLPPRTASPAGATVFFISPGDGEAVSNPIRIEFGISGMTVVAAGVDAAQSGHHHLLVDTDLPDLELPVPADSNHIHFGDASTSTELTLAPGEHTLQLLLADHAHIPHDPPVMSGLITITVK